MLCKPETLRTALNNYHTLRETRSIHLLQVRAKWLPIRILKRTDKRRVRYVAESILFGNFKDPEGLSEEMRIAVVLCAVQGWADTMRHYLKKGMSGTLLTERLFAFLLYIPIDHAVLAIRNDSFNLQMIQEMKLTKIPVFMQVFIAIKAHWSTIGLKRA